MRENDSKRRKERGLEEEERERGEKKGIRGEWWRERENKKNIDTNMNSM